jgi:hypothetical protein
MERGGTAMTPELLSWADVAFAEWRMLRSSDVGDQGRGAAGAPQSAGVCRIFDSLTSRAAV